MEGDTVTPWDARTGRRAGPSLGVGARVRARMISQDGAQAAIVRADGAIDVLEARTGALGRPGTGPQPAFPASQWALPAASRSMPASPSAPRT